MALTRLGPNQSVNLASNVTGALPIANGGTALTSGFVNGVANPGKVLQVVSAASIANNTTSATSYEDIPNLSVSITPSAASSKILVQFVTYVSNTHGNTWWHRLLRDSTALNEAAGSSSIDAGGDNASAWNRNKGNNTYLDSPNSTSALTYKLQWKVDGNVVCLNQVGSATSRGGGSTITVMEIGA